MIRFLSGATVSPFFKNAISSSFITFRGIVISSHSEGRRSSIDVIK
jgi:hypothetical protein